ncbi:hypothetical protein [Kribbella speibonae]|uniref:ApeA N-terminal domain-containing protein n=1 Tax=Kribbella speibonae TaxID=1572660 RepID=A0A4R0IF85_9ACTN|nr:hypothetical protein [Kribbella speibonae]TCC30684.1 hypothetical protein E0H92_36785 [Kribbella speibonae]
MEKLDDVGTFWLATEPERKVHGALTYDSATIGRLRLDGVLGLTRRPSGYVRLLGQSQERAYTLERCFEKSRKGSVFGPAGPGTSIWSVGEVFTNVHFSADEDLVFDRMMFELEDLASWLGRSGISTDGMEAVDGALVAQIEHRWLRRDALATDFGELEIVHNLGQRNYLPRELTLWQSFGMRIKLSSTVPKSELLDIASDLQDIVSIGIDRPSAYTQVQFSHPDAVQDPDDPQAERVDIEHYGRWIVKEGAYDRPPADVAFSYADIGDAPGLRAWLALAADHRSTLARIMAARRPTGMYSEDRLLNAVAAAEGLHRDLTGNRAEVLKARLIQLAQLAGPRFEAAVVDVDKWSEFLKEERHGHAHNRSQRPSSNVDHYRQMADSVYWLIVLCMLSQIPTAWAAIEHAERSSGFEAMADAIGEIMARL